MEYNEEKAFYNKIGKTIGWDFSMLQCEMIDNSKFQYFDEINKNCQNKTVLDIGTGGGEKALQNIKNAKFLVGTDFSSEMIKKANQNAESRNDVKFVMMDSNKIQFPNGFYDVVCARHTPFNAEEVYRTLSNSGMLFSEQVDEDDCLELKEIFGRGQGYKESPKLIDKIKTDLGKCNFSKTDFYDIIQDEYYKTEEDLLFLLNNTPIIPNFGKEANDYEKFNTYVNKYTTDKGIYLKRRLFGVIVKK
jgi:hypothetical protein